jgi:hypothetical protein
VPDDERVDVPPTATGGIVMRPQVRLVGEAGPEAIIPLNRMNGNGGEVINQPVQIMLNDRVLADAMIRIIPGRLGILGAAR